MRNYIEVSLDQNHCYNCIGEILARQNENNASALRIHLTDEMLDKWLYIEFIKPDKEKVCTPKLDIDSENKVVVYPISNSLTDKTGTILIEIVLKDGNGLVWKTFTKKYEIVSSINATQEIAEAKPDVIAGIQKEIEELKKQIEELNKKIESGEIPPEDVELTQQEIQALNEMVASINESGELEITYDDSVLDFDIQIQNDELVVENNMEQVEFAINSEEELEVMY